MLKRLIIFGLLTSVLQTLMYCLTLIIVWYILGFFDNQYEYGPMAGFAVMFLVFLFLIIVTLQNIITTIVSNKWLTIMLFILTFCIISLVEFYGFIDKSREYLLRTILILIAGLVSLIIKFPIDSFLKKRQKK